MLPFILTDLCIVRHTDLDIKINFEKQILEGNATLEVEKTGETEFLVSI